MVIYFGFTIIDQSGVRRERGFTGSAKALKAAQLVQPCSVLFSLVQQAGQTRQRRPTGRAVAWVWAQALT
jgi:hypothetical protein